MKTVLLLVVCSISLYFCNVKAEKKGKETGKAVFAFSDTINYKVQVLPILQKKCTPCHFPGGKMYDRMPFYNSQTIISHEAGVLKRFKDEQEIALIKQFIQQIKTAVKL
jgi:hypothetical protein